jgi:hypothetical protein
LTEGTQLNSQIPEVSQAAMNIFTNISQVTQDLTLGNKLVYYEAIGSILSGIPDVNVLTRAIEVALGPLIRDWKIFIQNIEANTDMLSQDTTLQHISFFINVNERMNFCIKDRYIKVFDVIFNEMIVIYKYYTRFLGTELQKNQNALSHYSFKKIRAIRRDILKLFTTFVSNSSNKSEISVVYLPSLFDLLKLYKYPGA